MFFNHSNMSDIDPQVELETLINASLDSDDSQEESEVDSDAVAAESEDEAATEEEEETSEDVSEDSADDSEADKEVEFDFHNTKTSIDKLVENLKNLSPEDRDARISKLTRAKEIEAVKEAFPDAGKVETPVTREEFNALMKKLEDSESPERIEKLQKALEIASKLNATEGLTDSRMKDLMLQEQFGESSKDVSNDPKFIATFAKYPKLSIEDRLEIACSLSPVAKKLATSKEVKNQVKLQNTKTVSKGKQTNASTEMTAKDVNSLADFEKMLGNKFN